MQATDEVPCLVLGGSSDALQCPAMEETKMSHASPFRGRRPILYLPRFSDGSACARSVLDFSFKEMMRHKRQFFSGQTHYLAVMDGDLCCRIQRMCILDISCDAN